MGRAWWKTAAFALVLGLSFLPASAQQAPRRVALIISNATYEGYPPLPNTAVDAGLVEAALRRVGFEVQRQSDLGIGPMRTALGAFQTRAEGADVALVYFAGHGMEAGGKNWLIPTDARLSTDAELDFQAIEANLVIRAVGGALARIIVLDACRDNPFAARMRSTGVYRVTRATGAGLSALDVQSARGTLLMYSAAAGEQADDGAPGQGSPFARAFSQHIGQPGVELRLAAGKVADAVYSETRERQLPFTTASLSGVEIFLGGKRIGAPEPGSVADFRQAAFDHVFFASNSADVPEEGRTILRDQATWLKVYPFVRVLVSGNAARKERAEGDLTSREDALALGARRAAAVKDLLVSLGVAASRIDTVSYGNERPLDTVGSEEAAGSVNRNVQTELLPARSTGDVRSRPITRARRATITSTSVIFPTMNRECVAWPTEAMFERGGVAGAGRAVGWGTYRPEVGNTGEIVGEVKHCSEIADRAYGNEGFLYILQIGENYVLISSSGVRIQ